MKTVGVAEFKEQCLELLVTVQTGADMGWERMEFRAW